MCGQSTGAYWIALTRSMALIAAIKFSRFGIQVRLNSLMATPPSILKTGDETMRSTVIEAMNL
ncbi:hypothetical protein CO667_22435 [Rhizobium sp. L43]|nr:hypothetical protein CO667_22435 [Rhizobium sp. L43]